MPTTPRSQAALAADPNFLARLSSLLLQEAMAISSEPPSTPNYAARYQLTQRVFQNPEQAARTMAPTICNATNLVAANTTYNFEAAAIETSADDAAIRSQISTLWNTLAGSPPPAL